MVCSRPVSFPGRLAPQSPVSGAPRAAAPRFRRASRRSSPFPARLAPRPPVSGAPRAASTRPFTSPSSRPTARATTSAAVLRSLAKEDSAPSHQAPSPNHPAPSTKHSALALGQRASRPFGACPFTSPSSPPPTQLPHFDRQRQAARVSAGVMDSLIVSQMLLFATSISYWLCRFCHSSGVVPK